MLMMFVNRTDELNELRAAMSAKHPLMIVYGRRRIGKTALALQLAKDIDSVYYVAREFKNLQRLKETVSKRFPEIQDLRDDWEVIFKFLDGRVSLLIIDEFQNLIREDKRILTTFQIIVDEYLKKSRLLILGSSISMMTSRVLSYQSPLYGRRSLAMELRPLNFFDAMRFYRNITKEEMVKIYGVTGGVPYYLERVTPPFRVWIDEELKHSTFIKDEVDFLLRYELSKPSIYKMILEAIANGNTDLGRIKNYCGLRKTDISQYLKNLITIGLIRREVPITETPMSRKGRYYLQDQFITFWFRLISPRLNELEHQVLRFSHFEDEYNTYLGDVFEKIALQYIIRSRPFPFTRVGRWWHREKEIDIIAIDRESNTAYFCEVKWSAVTDPDRLLESLKSKSSELYEEMNKEYVLIAKSFVRKTERAKCIDLNGMR